MRDVSMKFKGSVYLISSLSVILWGISYIWADELIDKGVDPAYFVPIRITIAGVVLLLINWATGNLVAIRRKDLPRFILLSLCEPLIYFLAESYGIQETGSPTISAMIIASSPIIAVGAGLVFFKEKISWLNISGMLLCLVGICLVVMQKGELGSHYILGIILLVVAVLAEVAHASITKTLADGYRSQVIVMYQFLIGSVLFIPIFATKGMANFQPYYLSFGVLRPILYLAILCSSVAFSLWVVTIKRLGVAKSGIFTSLIPVATAIVAFILGQDRLGAHQWAGIAISLVGVMLSQYIIKRHGQK